MKLPRPDLTTLVLAGLCIVAITTLALFHVAIPDVLTFLAMGSLAGGVGIAAPTSSSDGSAARITDALARLEALSGRSTAAKLPPRAAGIPAPAPAPGATTSAGAAA